MNLEDELIYCIKNKYVSSTADSSNKQKINLSFTTEDLLLPKFEPVTLPSILAVLGGTYRISLYASPNVNSPGNITFTATVELLVDDEVVKTQEWSFYKGGSADIFTSEIDLQPLQNVTVRITYTKDIDTPAKLTSNSISGYIIERKPSYLIRME